VNASLGKRLFLWGLGGSLSVTALLAIGILLFAEFDELAGRILATTALLGLFSLLSLPAGVLLDQGRFRPLAWASLALNVVGFALTMLLVWQDDGGSDNEWKLLATVVAAAVATSQTAATTSRLRPGDPPSIRVLYPLSVFLVFAVAAMVALAAWNEIEDETYYRLLGASAVANLLVALLQPIVRRAAGLRAPPGAPAAQAAHRLVFTLDRVPSESAIAEAASALERAGARVERVERPD
jgi:drug/metabolite transporter (DMT)-like permease